MSLTSLPEEVLEAILLHVPTQDISNVLSVVGSGGSEGFWRKICVRNEYKKLLEDETWKCVFHRNITWLKGSYMKSEYNIADLPASECDVSRNAEFEEQDEPRTSNLNRSHSVSTLPVGCGFYFFLKRNKLLFQKQDGVLFLDAGNPNTLLQTLQGVSQDECDLSRTKLLVRSPDRVIVYSYDKDHYKELFPWNCNNVHSVSYVLTDDYFVILKHAQRSVTVVDLNVMELYSLQASPRKGRPFNVSVCDLILNLVISDGNDYVLRRYDLGRREWLEDIHLFGAAAMFEVPRVKMNQRAIVSWSWHLESHCSFMLKIWPLEGNKGQRTIAPANVLWLILEADYVIYSTAKTSISIQNINEPDKIKSMAMSEHFHLGQNIVSSFLVLSYTNGFKLVDFKKATYLYEVLFDSGFECKQFCVNEYFYIAYNTSCNDESHSKLCIYDFRGHPVDED